MICYGSEVRKQKQNTPLLSQAFREGNRWKLFGVIYFLNEISQQQHTPALTQWLQFSFNALKASYGNVSVGAWTGMAQVAFS